eukprot:295527_1
MAAEKKKKSDTAKTSIVCSSCDEVSLADEALFMCTWRNCSKAGEALCKDCGKSTHKRKNHEFDPDQDHIKPVDLCLIQQKFEKGQQIIRQTFAAQNDHTAANRRVMIQSGATSVLHPCLTAVQGHADGRINWLVEDFLSADAGIGLGCMQTTLLMATETLTHTSRFMSGEIKTWKEYGYHMAKGYTTAIGTGIGAAAGSIAGARIGTLIGGPISTIIGGIIGGMSASVLATKLTKNAFEALFPGDFIIKEQTGREQMIRDSLKLFGFKDIKDIENPEIFNIEELKKQYRILAKRYHPDRNAGSTESQAHFQEIVAAYGVLCHLLEKNDKKEVVRKLTEIRAIKWKKDIQQLGKILKQKKLMYIVNICYEWNDKLTMEFISKMAKEELLQTLRNIDSDNKFKYNIQPIERSEFVNVIEQWSHDSNDWRWMNQVKSEQVKEDDMNDQKENDAVDDIEYDEIKELKDELRNNKLLDVVKICETYNEEYCLESLMGYRKNDILEVLDEINNDDSNDYKISVGKKNKFAKIVCKFAEKEPEQLLSK